MNPEERYDRLKIDFPRGLNLKQSEDLVKYLAGKLRANVDYGTSCNKSAVYTKERAMLTGGFFKLEAEISSLDNAIKFDTFTMKSELVSDIYEVRKLEFFMTSGLNINESRKKVLEELHSDVREAVERYFEFCF